MDSKRRSGTPAGASDLHVGVILDQALNFGDHRRMGLAQLWSGEWQRQPERVRGAATEADPGDHLIGFQQRHVFQEQTDHALALALRSGRIVPESREVRHQSHNLPTLVRTEHAAFCGALTLVVLLGCG